MGILLVIVIVFVLLIEVDMANLDKQLSRIEDILKIIERKM